MGMQRIAEPIVWDDKAAKRTSSAWGCWACGNEDSYVHDTGKDAEHIRVRRRQCTRCGQYWETEEKRIGRGTFFARAENRRYAAFRKTHYRIRTCLMCKERYLQSEYAKHTQESKAHGREVARREKRKRRAELKYRREWMRAKRQIEKANRGETTCPRCGGVYTIGQLRTHHSKTKTHQKALREQKNERRQARRHSNG